MLRAVPLSIDRSHVEVRIVLSRDISSQRIITAGSLVSVWLLTTSAKRVIEFHQQDLLREAHRLLVWAPAPETRCQESDLRAYVTVLVRHYWTVCLQRLASLRIDRLQIC